MHGRGALIGAMLTVQACVLGVGGYLTLREAKEDMRPLVMDAVAMHDQAGVRAGEGTAEAIWISASAAGVVLLGVTLVGTSLIVRTYDNALERMNRQLEHEVVRKGRQELAIRNGLIFGLAKLAEERDSDTGRHLERICAYAGLLAQELAPHHREITPAWIERLRLAASLHDIGKVGVPDAILLKAGRLTEQERAIMQRHALIGAGTLAAIRQKVGSDELLSMAIEIASCHHERWDGTGYPFGMREEQIPVAARIVALADVYDALTSARPYKIAMGHQEAARIVCDGRGTHFDPQVVDAFERALGRFDDVRTQLAASDAGDHAPQPITMERLRAHATLIAASVPAVSRHAA